MNPVSEPLMNLPNGTQVSANGWALLDTGTFELVHNGLSLRFTPNEMRDVVEVGQAILSSMVETISIDEIEVNG